MATLEKPKQKVDSYFDSSFIKKSENDEMKTILLFFLEEEEGANQ